MSEQSTVGNEPTTTVEKMKIGEHEVKVKKIGEGENVKYEIEAPEGLENDKGFLEKSTKAISALAIANQKGFKTNQRSKELDEREAILAKREANLKLQEETKVEIPSTVDLMMKDLGLRDEDELEDLTYAERKRAEDKANAKIANLRSQNANQTQLVNSFIKKGGDYNGLRTYANTLKSPITQALINSYERINKGVKPNFATDELANIQKAQISIVKRGGLSAGYTKSPVDVLLELGNNKNRL
ncbi:MAG: hypothetical protein DRP35_09610 [Candidatus Zixiibacteriota bacterium]|nr:MAG: hypothetical protein DRP35_09610 [candidate division Zixibacteria bacterium]